MFIDTHAHYDDKAFDTDRDDVINNAHLAGAEVIVNAAQDYLSSIKCIELAEKFNFVYAAVGVHPHEAGNVTWKKLRN